jgi:Rrf2 family protein
MLFSKGCAYAIRASLLLSAKDEKREFVPIRELAEELDLSFHFLTKIMQELSEAGIVTSFRGPNGGVGLARSSRSIRLIDVIDAIDGDALFTECALGLPECTSTDPCPLHDAWSKRKADLQRLFSETSLADLAEGLSRKRLRSASK